MLLSKKFLLTQISIHCVQGKLKDYKQEGRFEIRRNTRERGLPMRNPPKIEDFYSENSKFRPHTILFCLVHVRLTFYLLLPMSKKTQ